MKQAQLSLRIAWFALLAISGLSLAQCLATGEDSSGFDLAEIWPPAAGNLYAIEETSYDGNQIVSYWYPDGFEDKYNRAGMDGEGVKFAAALAFRVPDLKPGDKVTFARLRLSSAGAEMHRELTLEIQGLVGPPGGFSEENLPSEAPRTDARATWRISRPWKEGSLKLPLYYTSPDITPLVNEILSHPDFETGRTVAFIIQGTGQATGLTVYVKIQDFTATAESHTPALLEICTDPAGTLLTEPMLGRPTDRSVTVNLLGLVGMEAYAEFGAGDGPLTESTSPVRAEAGEPLEIVIDGLEPDTDYRYRIMYRSPGEGDFTPGSTGGFHTQRAAGEEYTFTIQADSHIIGNIKRRSLNNLRVYDLTIENALADDPDFHFSMGDFAHMEFYTAGNAAGLADAVERYLVQRRLLGPLTRETPFFLVIGNHEGEQGWRRSRESDSLEVWGTLARKITIPNPYPDGFYSGSTDSTDCCGLRENYYAWTWGDALFVVIDPFWYTTKMPHRAGGYMATMDAWDWTLGKEQYDWLYRTLTESDARWKFVFTHHLVGGVTHGHHRNHPYGRGGIDAAKYKVSNRASFEWGGEDDTGRDVFSEKRPGWEHGPIHDIMVETGVDILFHGHDHAFVREELDGIVYQECPIPSGSGYDVGFISRDFYTTGDLVNNSGHLMVTVSPDSVRVDYVRAVLPEDEPLMEDGKPIRNRTVAYSYSLER